MTPTLVDILKLQQELIDQLPDRFTVDLKRLSDDSPYLTVKLDSYKDTKAGCRVTIKGYKKTNLKRTVNWRWVSQVHYWHNAKRLGPGHWLTDKDVIEFITSYVKNEKLWESELDESRLKQALAAGAIAVSAMTGGSAPPPPTYLPQAEHESDLKRLSFKNFAKQHDARATELASVITDKYSVGSDLALKVAKLALKYEKPTFPKAEDILAVCGIESSFKPHAASKLKHDPAIGLMQVRPAIWKLDKQKLASSTEEQIKTGSEILHGYYQKLKTKEAALQAFNVGITNYMKKGLNPRYVPKFDAEREMYEGLTGDARKALLALQQLFSDFDDFDTELVHLEAGDGYRDRYRMKIHAPWADLWVDLDSAPTEWQKVSFGAGNRLGGGSTNETYDFHSEADLLDFVKKQYNRYITVKMGANAPMGLSGRRVDWPKYFLK